MVFGPLRSVRFASRRIGARNCVNKGDGDSEPRQLRGRDRVAGRKPARSVWQLWKGTVESRLSMSEDWNWCPRSVNSNEACIIILIHRLSGWYPSQGPGWSERVEGRLSATLGFRGINCHYCHSQPFPCPPKVGLRLSFAVLILVVLLVSCLSSTSLS